MALIRFLGSQEESVNKCIKSEKHSKMYGTWEGVYVSMNEVQAISMQRCPSLGQKARCF